MIVLAGNGTRIIAAAVATLVCSLASSASPAAAAPPAAAAGDSSVTPSHYVVAAGGQTADAQGYTTGCADGRAGQSGLRILLFGTQEADGRVRPPGTTRSSPAPRLPGDWPASFAAGWLRGFTECGQATAVLALGVNNKSDGGADPGRAGAAWAHLVGRVASAAPAGRVTVAGALDGEPSWSDPRWARGWVDAYVRSTSQALYAVGSADGCPTDLTTQACAHGWTVGDVYHIATGAASTVGAVPQIYRTDGVQARQWAAISAWGARTGAGPLRVVGVLTQRGACQRVGGCTRTNNSAQVAIDQLTQALDANPATRLTKPLIATDIDWPVPPPTP